jgi:hypothetical protein
MLIPYSLCIYQRRETILDLRTQLDIDAMERQPDQQRGFDVELGLVGKISIFGI